MADLRLIVMRVSAFILLAPVLAMSPQVNFPLSSQFPPVARIGEHYTFQFAPTTFQPDPDRLQYSLISNPSWLSLNGDTRTLWGTPGTGDVGAVTFTITAAGEAGAVANMETRLLVTDSQAPAIRGNISEHLANAGQLTGTNAVTLLPAKDFEVQFSKDMFEFENEDNELQYLSTLADHTPLPAWISFDAESLRFVGTTPATVSSPQVFDILLIASEGAEYATASVSFSLVVSHHQLLFKPLQQEIKLPKGDEVNITGLRDNLYMDNNPIREQDIKTASAELPSWLEFDDRTLEISGKPPSNVKSEDIGITVEDVFGDVAKHSISLLFASQLFAGDVGPLNITAGEHFEYQIPRSVLLSADEKVSIDFGPLEKWLDFDPTTLIISGTLPEDMSPEQVELSMTATSSDGRLSDTQDFVVSVTSSAAHDHSDQNSSNGKSGQIGHADNDDQQHSKSKAGVVAGAVVGALLGSFILAAFACILCRRKKKSKGYISPRSPRSPRKTDISRPIIIHDDWETIDKSMDPDLEKGDGDDTPTERTPERPPQIKLDLAAVREVSKSPVSSIGESESKILSSFDESPWGFKDQAGPSHQPHDSMRIPTAMARRESETSEAPTKHRRRTTAVYRDPQPSTGLPINRRVSGLGHGRHTYSPSRSTNNVSGYRRASSYNSYSTISTSILSTVPSAHNHQLIGARHTTQLTTPMDKRCSIRVVSKNVSSTCTSLAERRTIEEWRRSRNRRSTHDSTPDYRPIDERRQSYIRKRASAQSPFFGASSSRVSSSSYKAPPAGALEDETPKRPAPSPLAKSTLATPSDGDPMDIDSGFPNCLRIRKPADTPSVESSPIAFPGSLRKPATPRSFTGRHTTLPSTVMVRDRVHKRYERPETSYQASSASRRSSIRQSLRAQELKSSLNSLTGSKIFEDAEMSSAYSTEDEEIEEYEKRTTVKPDQFSLPPLDLERVRTSKIEPEADAESSQKSGQREFKKASQRDPTPYLFSREHGGKENQPLGYSLGVPPPVPLHKTGVTKPTRSPERPKTIATTSPQRPALRSRHSRSASRNTVHSGTRQSHSKPLSRQHSSRSRHSRGQSATIAQSRPQSRHSTSKPKTRDRSRTQSSAFPHFDISTLLETLKDPSKDNTQEAKTTTLPNTNTAASLPRDLDGNVINYALHEDPTIEELASSSIGVGASGGRIKSEARQSRLAPQMTTSKRQTAIPTYTPTRPDQKTYSIGLGLNFPLLDDDNNSTTFPSSPPERAYTRERTPLSVLDDGNGASPERLRVVEGKGKRPVSREVDEELQKGASREGRTTWGSLKSRVMGARNADGSVKGYWDGRDWGTKAFL